MPDMKSTSASLYGSRPSPAGVACRRSGGALAQPAPSAATNRAVAIAGGEAILIRVVATYRMRFALRGEPAFLLRSQRDHRIDARRPLRRHEHRHERHDGDERR